MTAIIPIASGKGGVGKTIFTANMGITLAQSGKTVILADLDLGAANLHTILGIRNRQPGIGHVISKKESSIENLVIDTNIPRLHFLPGDALIPGTANLAYFSKKKIIRELHNLVADYVLLDLGAGSNYNTIDFYLSGSYGIVVCTPETTSVLNAYSFIKTALYRLLVRSFPAGSQERTIIMDYMSSRIEGGSESLIQLADKMPDHTSADIIRQRLTGFTPRIVLNNGKSADELPLGGKLRHIARKNLNIEMEYIGFLPHDPCVELSPFERVPTALNHPECMFMQALRGTAASVQRAAADPELQNLYDDNEDLYSAARQYIDATGEASESHL